jgi:acetate kinase
MDTILVVNAGSSSVKFQVYALGMSDEPQRLIKGQFDGVGSRPRLCAETRDGCMLIDKSYSPHEIGDVSAAITTAGSWLRATQSFDLIAVGHRVVHGGPHFDRPVVIDRDVLARLEQYVPLAPLHQPNNLAPIRTLLGQRPDLVQVACFDTAFHRTHSGVADRYAIPESFYVEGVRRYGFHGLLRIRCQPSARYCPGRRGRARHRRASRQRCVNVRPR